MKHLALILFLASALSAQIFYPPGSVRRYAGTPTAGDCTAGAAGRKAANIAAVPTVPYYCGQTSTDVWEWVVEAAGSGSGDVLGASNLTAVGAIPRVASSGTLGQSATTITAAGAITIPAGENLNLGGSGYLNYTGGGAMQMGGNSFISYISAHQFRGTVSIGPSNTSPSGTLHVHDATATTGVTTLTVRAGQANSITSGGIALLNNSGSNRGTWAVDANGSRLTLWDSSTAPSVRLDGGGVTLASTSTILFTSGDTNASADAGIKRASANNLAVTNGSSTNYWLLGSSGIQCGSGDGNSAACDVGVTGARVRNVNAAGDGTFGGDIFAGSTAAIRWTNRSRITSPADGVILLRDVGAVDFGRLQFGGTTSSFPAEKRNGTNIEFRLADDSAYTAAVMSEVYLGGAAGTDGTWRLSVSGGSLLIQKRESGSYVTKQVVTP